MTSPAPEITTPKSISILEQSILDKDDIFNRLPIYKTSAKAVNEQDDAVFREEELARTWNNGFVYMSKDTAANFKVAMPVIKNPITVFRDTIQRIGTNETTTIREFIGLIRVPAGVSMVYVLENQGFIVKINLIKTENEKEIFEQLRGVRIYKKRV